MVFVELQYRVGIYGFLASKDIKNDGNLNAGLLDQRAVLLWVQKYISKVCVYQLSWSRLCSESF